MGHKSKKEQRKEEKDLERRVGPHGVKKLEKIAQESEYFSDFNKKNRPDLSDSERSWVHSRYKEITVERMKKANKKKYGF